jgi:hypothetical protein
MPGPSRVCPEPTPLPLHVERSEEPPTAIDVAEEGAPTAAVFIADRAAERVGEMIARSSVVAANPTGVSALFGQFLGEAATTVGWGWNIYEMTEDIVTAESQGRVRGVLEAAFAEGIETDNPIIVARREARAVGIGAVFTGASDEQIAELADRYPGSSFREGVESARALRADHPDDFAEAQERYLEVRRQWEEGVAAQLIGWPHPAPTQITRNGEAYASRRLPKNGDAAVAGLRMRARADHAEGFRAKVAGRVDEERARTDVSYRLGVHRASAAMRSGPEAVRTDEQLLDLERGVAQSRCARVEG